MFEQPGVPVVVPAVIDQLSSMKVLTMEFEEGVRIDNLAELKRLGINPANVSRELIALFSRMMFLHGFCHTGPFSSNLFPSLVLLLRFFFSSFCLLILFMVSPFP